MKRETFVKTLEAIQKLQGEDNEKPAMKELAAEVGLSRPVITNYIDTLVSVGVLTKLYSINEDISNRGYGAEIIKFIKQYQEENKCAPSAKALSEKYGKSMAWVSAKLTRCRLLRILTKRYKIDMDLFGRLRV